MDITTIDLFGIRVDEPVTTVTDLLVAGVCFFAFAKMLKIKNPINAQRFFRNYFFLMGLATTLGGIFGHAFLYAFQFDWQDLPTWFLNMFTEKYSREFASKVFKLPGWIVSMFGVSYLERGSIAHARIILPKKLGLAIKIANYVELFLFMFITIFTINFFFIEVHSAFGILIVTASLQLFLFIRTRDKSSLNVLIAVAFSAISALIFMNEIAISKWFNHLDISHVLMSIGIYFTYRGAKLIDTGRIKNSSFQR